VCGRFNLTKPEEPQARFDFIDWHERRIEPRFNIAPSQDILTIVQHPLGAPFAQDAKWGLAPPWLQPTGKRPPPINARAESVASSGMFRSALAKTRCLIPATGFYEWRADPNGAGKTPMHIQLKDGEPFAFAGLWVPDKDGQPTAAIITTGANELMRSLHTRMPVILRREDELLWLDPEVTDVEMVQPLLQPYPSELMSAWPVSRLVNSVANDSPELIAPV
jgi:putative SOS response-associated peptidase YedK